MSTVLKAYEIAAKAHACQKRDGGEDYINHPIRVALRCADDWEGFDDAEQISENMQAALLHDVIEDTHIKLEDIIEHGFNSYVVELLETLTRKDNQTYFEYIKDIAAGHDFSYAAAAIKKADILDNYDTATESMKDRYDKALLILNYKDDSVSGLPYKHIETEQQEFKPSEDYRRNDCWMGWYDNKENK